MGQQGPGCGGHRWDEWLGGGGANLCGVSPLQVKDPTVAGLVQGGC